MTFLFKDGIVLISILLLCLPDIGAQVSSGMRAENVTFFIYYGDKLVYNETEENANLKKVCYKLIPFPYHSLKLSYLF